MDDLSNPVLNELFSGDSDDKICEKLLLCNRSNSSPNINFMFSDFSLKAIKALNKYGKGQLNYNSSIFSNADINTDDRKMDSFINEKSSVDTQRSSMNDLSAPNSVQFEENLVLEVLNSKNFLHDSPTYHSRTTCESGTDKLLNILFRSTLCNNFHNKKLQDINAYIKQYFLTNTHKIDKLLHEIYPSCKYEKESATSFSHYIKGKYNDIPLLSLTRTRSDLSMYLCMWKSMGNSRTFNTRFIHEDIINKSISFALNQHCYIHNFIKNDLLELSSHLADDIILTSLDQYKHKKDLVNLSIDFAYQCLNDSLIIYRSASVNECQQYKRKTNDELAEFVANNIINDSIRIYNSIKQNSK